MKKLTVSLVLGFAVFAVSSVVNPSSAQAACSDYTSSTTCNSSCSPVKSDGKSYACKWLSDTSKCRESTNICGGSSGGDTRPFCDSIQVEEAGLYGSWPARCTNLGAKTCQVDSSGRNTGYQCTCTDLSPSACKFYANNCSTLNLQACPISTTTGTTSGNYQDPTNILCGSKKVSCRADNCHCLFGESCTDQQCDPQIKTICTDSGRSWCKQGAGATCCVAGYKCGPNSTGCVLVTAPTSTPTTYTRPVAISPDVEVACPYTAPTPVTFRWTAVAGAARYFIRIDNKANGWLGCGANITPNAGDYCIDNISGSSTSYTRNLGINKTYEWWVSSYNSTGTQSALSNRLTFKIPALCPGTPPPSPTATPKVTPPPLTAQCVSTRVYSPNWTPMTETDFYNLLPNSQVYFCVAGSTTGGAFDRARFTINGVLRPDVTLLRPGTGDFCDLYTIPSAVYDYKIQGEVHHNTLGWL